MKPGDQRQCVAMIRMSDPLAGRFRLGIIPTLARYLLPLVFAPLREALPALEVEPWEDQTTVLLERLRAHELDAALLATEMDGPDLASRKLFAEPFLAALPPEHPLAGRAVVAEADLARDILVLADGHCLRGQALAACGHNGASNGALRASSPSTLLNMVAAAGVGQRMCIFRRAIHGRCGRAMVPCAAVAMLAVARALGKLARVGCLSVNDS